MYNSYFNQAPNGYLTGCSDEIEQLRPKSPPRKVQSADVGGGGIGRGVGLGVPTASMQRGGSGPKLAKRRIKALPPSPLFNEFIPLTVAPTSIVVHSVGASIGGYIATNC